MKEWLHHQWLRLLGHEMRSDLYYRWADSMACFITVWLLIVCLVVGGHIAILTLFGIW